MLPAPRSFRIPAVFFAFLCVLRVSALSFAAHVNGRGRSTSRSRFDLLKSAKPLGQLAGLMGLALLLCGIYASAFPRGSSEEKATATASVLIDATRVEGAISTMLYGQFDEFMFEGVKRGLTAELIRGRSFEEPPSAIGLPRDWERYPDDRNDDPILHFRWDPSV